MRASNLQGLLRIASCVVLLAAPLAACSDDDSSTAGTNGDGDRVFDPGAPISLDECLAQSGFHITNPSGSSLPEMTRCPSGTDPIALIDDLDVFALCCFIEYELCKPQRVQVGGTCDTDIAYYFLGSGCAPIRECACVGPDCGEGYATEDECMAAYEGCESGARLCGTLNGQLCPPDTYCSESACSPTTAGGLCVPIPTACEDALEPVCGCDGVTYDNECELAKQTMSLRSFSACDAPADP